jgi:hypothetical protein
VVTEDSGRFFGMWMAKPLSPCNKFLTGQSPLQFSRLLGEDGTGKRSDFFQDLGR